MIKILFKIVLIFYITSSYLYSEIVNDVSIDGNKRISKETILVLGEINLDENYNDDKLNLILKNLYESNFFKDINLSVDSNTLFINVIENPIIESIEITGIKNKSKIENILETMSLKPRVSFFEDKLDKDINTIKNIFKINGYYFSKVTSSIKENKELNTIVVKIDIDEGEKAKIKDIVFIGDKKIKDKKLLELIVSEEHKFWKFLTNKVFINQQNIELDKRLLENYYKNLGYYNVKILESFAEYNKNNNFKLTFNIDAGTKYFFNEFNLILPEDYNQSDFSSVNNTLSKLVGKNYSLDSLNLLLLEIEKIASTKLYDFIDAEIEELVVFDNKINFTIVVKDSKKHYVERVNIIGNYNTIEEVIRNNLIIDEGDPINSLLLNKSIDNIRSLGIFKSVTNKIIDGSADNLKNIEITVEEMPTGEISLGAGYGTNGATLAAGIIEKNFLGKGINLNTNIEINEDSLKGIFVYSKPNFAYTDNTLFTSLRSETDDFLTDSGYKVSNLGFSVGTKYEQYENFYFNPELDVSHQNLETNSTASRKIKDQKGKYNDLYFNYGLNYDLRDSKFNPTSGQNIFFYQKLPLISDGNEIENTFSLSTYKKLSQNSDMVGKVSFYLKNVDTLDGSDVRISKRVNVPFNRLRGFEKGKIGPIENSDYIGGNYVSALNISANFPQVLLELENVELNYFIDIANVWGVDYDKLIDDSNAIRSSTGIGIDFLTPIGPLSISLAQPITKKSTDKTENFRFNIGTTF